jgi:ABC-type uncharacterized transport system substrate-binding protein
MIKEAVPGLTRVAVLRDPANAANLPTVKTVEMAARMLGLQLQMLQSRTSDELERAFSAMARGSAGTLVVLGDTMFRVHQARLAELAARSRLPAIFTTREHVEADGLMAYGPSGAIKG